ncbi:MAG: hypothetical protein AAGJ35_01845, partial [Myxococcota bacterium]
QTLDALHLVGSEVDTELATFLFAHPSFPALQELRLESNPLRDAAVIALLSSPKAEVLQELSLGWCELENETAISIAQSPKMTQLEVLELQGNDIDMEGALAIAQSPYLTSLRTLNMKWNTNSLWKDEAGAAELAQSPYLAQLETLLLNRFPLTANRAKRPHPSTLSILPWEDEHPIHWRTMMLAYMCTQPPQPQWLEHPKFPTLLEFEQHEALHFWTMCLLEAWHCAAAFFSMLEQLSFPYAHWEQKRLQLLAQLAPAHDMLRHFAHTLEQGLFS